MNIKKDVPLKDYSTMKLGGSAKFLVDIHSESELIEAIAWAKSNNLPYLMIGGGSNLFWRDEGFSGIVLVNRIPGIKTKKVSENEYEVTAGAGESWDGLVESCVAQGLSGIEYLSLIPGSCGAAPIQNIGAYGSDISKVLVSLRAYDVSSEQFINLSKAECKLGYRDSIFKHLPNKNRFLVVSISIKLTNKKPEPPYYPAIETYLKTKDIKLITPLEIRNAVISIRQSKLPDPKLVANNGSFFTNPIISNELLKRLITKYPEMVSWPIDTNNSKVSAGWLIEQIGYKDKYDPTTGMATWIHHTLTLVNKSAQTTKDLLIFRDQIIDKVSQKFDIKLEQEPELLP